MKNRKFDRGGAIQDMTPEDVAEEKAREKASRAYDQAMPEPDTTFGKLKKFPKTGVAAMPDRRPPGRYDSIRSKGFEEGINADKSAAMKQGLSGLGQMAKQTGIVAATGPLGAFVADHDEGIRGGKKTINAYEKFKEASSKKDAADREMASQLRRETRGVEFKQGGKIKNMSSGGSMNASKRADGIAQRGKTKGRMC